MTNLDRYDEIRAKIHGGDTNGNAAVPRRHAVTQRRGHRPFPGPSGKNPAERDVAYGEAEAATAVMDPPRRKPGRPAKGAEDAGKQRLFIQAIRTELLTIYVRGISPLIMNRFSQKALNQIERKHRGDSVQKKGPKDPGANYEAAFYTDEDGHAAMPATAFKASALDAANQLDDAKKTVLRGAFFVQGDYVRIYGTPHGRTDPVRNSGVNATCDIRHRPCFQDWAAIIIVQYKPNIITAEQLVNLYNEAGFSCGIGDWRPASKRNYSGSKGRYTVVRAEDIKDLMKAPQSLKSNPKWWKLAPLEISPQQEAAAEGKRGKRQLVAVAAEESDGEDREQFEN